MSNSGVSCHPSFPSPVQLFARGGYTVSLYDISDDQLKGALSAIEQQLVTLETQGLLKDGQTAAELVKRVSCFTKLQEAATGAVYIQVCAGVHC